MFDDPTWHHYCGTHGDLWRASFRRRALAWWHRRAWHSH